MAEFDASTFDVSPTGFDADEVDALLNKFYSKEAIQDDFDVDKEKEAHRVRWRNTDAYGRHLVAWTTSAFVWR